MGKDEASLGSEAFDGARSAIEAVDMAQNRGWKQENQPLISSNLILFIFCFFKIGFPL